MTFSCRSCGLSGAITPEVEASRLRVGSDQLVRVLDLGVQPLANRLLPAHQTLEPEPRFPLDLVFCTRCMLLQISETVPPEMMFRHYVYFSSFSDTFLNHAEALAERLIRERQLNSESLVVEAASNDGYLLQFFAKKGIPVLGIDPASNVVEVARAKGIPSLDEFFGAEIAGRLVAEGKRATVFVANNVLAHVPAINNFVAGIAELLHPEGVASIEFPYLRDMIDHLEFDTIYHEHLSYFSLSAAANLFHRHGLAIERVERLKVHGGSLRLFVASTKFARPDDSVAQLLTEEKERGIHQPVYYLDFSRRVRELREKLRTLLLDLKTAGKRIAAYGASAKGSTLLNYLDVGTDLIDYVVDRSPHKQGMLMPGVHLPIDHPRRLIEDLPDYVLLLTWNFAEEILAQQAECRALGAKFILPVPEPTIV
ncbi:MAG: class I SAM-dependent methyltransferase [Planctomycetota bacterium]